MKKSNGHSKRPDLPKPIETAGPAEDKKQLQAVAPPNISRERILDGASKTTEVLSEILRRREYTEQIRHWGINE